MATQHGNIGSETAKPAGNDGAPKPGSANLVSPSSKPAWPRVIAVICVVVLLSVSAVAGVRQWRFSSTHVSTDNAQLTNDTVQVAPQVSGTVQKVLVNDNDVVRSGQLLAVLDDSMYRATRDQAKANLQAAIAQARGAGVTVAVTAQTGAGQVTQAQGAVAQAEGGVAAAVADTARADAMIATARAAVSGARATVLAARADVDSAVATRQKAAAGLVSAQSQVETARAAASAARASIAAAQAAVDKAEQDARRYDALVAQGAMSAQTGDQARYAVRTANAQLQAAKEQATSLEAAVEARKSEVAAARQQVSTADAGVSQARAHMMAAEELVKAAQAQVRQSSATRVAAGETVNQASAKRLQAMGQLSQARTAPKQVAVSQAAQAQAAAKIEQARAALRTAEIQLGYTRIYAPCTGRVSKKTVEVGALVSPGLPLMALVPAREPWVVANFKETQLAAMRDGQSVDVDVDGIPGITFHGHVDSLAGATGATFALLPPDNATGNFTKVVQRIPVKIVLDPGQRGADRLRAGMSVVAVVDVSRSRL